MLQRLRRVGNQLYLTQVGFVMAAQVLNVEDISPVGDACMGARNGLLCIKCCQINVSLQATSWVRSTNDLFCLCDGKALYLHSILLKAQIGVHVFCYSLSRELQRFQCVE